MRASRAHGSPAGLCHLTARGGMCTNIVTLKLLACYSLGMGNPAGVHRDFEGLEQRRRDAAELLRKGMCARQKWHAVSGCIDSR